MMQVQDLHQEPLLQGFAARIRRSPMHWSNPATRCQTDAPSPARHAARGRRCKVVADGTIYLYFNNKYDILISVFEEEIGKIIDQIRKILATETDPKKMLEMYVTRHLQTMKKTGTWPR